MIVAEFIIKALDQEELRRVLEKVITSQELCLVEIPIASEVNLALTKN